MDGPVFSREDELLQRLDDQQYELESLREQKRDKDAAICFLKTKITTLQNKAGVHATPKTNGQTPLGQVAQTVQLREEDLQSTLRRRESYIEELEMQVADLSQELRERAHAQENEVEELRSAIANCEANAVDMTGRENHETLDLRRQLQLRDEEVQSVGLAYETLQQHCQLQARTVEEAYEKFKRHKEDELQRSADETRRLSGLLQQTTAGSQALSTKVEELQGQLQLKSNEVARLADTLEECLERAGRGQLLLPHDRQVGHEAPRLSPRLAPAPPSPESTMENGRWTSPERAVPASEGESGSRGGEPGQVVGLQERRDSVLQLEEEIHKQIARHRHSFGGQSAGGARSPSPLSGQSPGGARASSPFTGGQNQSPGGAQRATSPFSGQSPGRGPSQEPSPQSARCPWPVTVVLPNGNNAYGSPRRGVSPDGRPLTPARDSRRAVSVDDRPLTPMRNAPGESSPQKADFEVPSKIPPPPSRCLEASPAAAIARDATGPMAALPLASGSMRSPAGRAATASRVERQAGKPTGNAGGKGGAVVSLSVFDQEDPSQKRAGVRQQLLPQQRVSKPQLDQRRRQVQTQKPTQVRPDEAWKAAKLIAENGISPLRPSSPQGGFSTGASVPAQAPRGLFRGPERIVVQPSSPEATVRPATAPVAAPAPVFTPSSPLVGGSASVPLGGGQRPQTSTASASARGRLAASARVPVATPVPDGVRGRAATTESEHLSEKAGAPQQGDLHQRFASLRDEMKRQRGPAASVITLGEQGGGGGGAGGRINAKEVLSDLLQTQHPEASAGLQKPSRFGHGLGPPSQADVGSWQTAA